MQQLAEGKPVDQPARCEMVRSLTSVLTATNPRPSKVDCDDIARELVKKYAWYMEVDISLPAHMSGIVTRFYSCRNLVTGN